MNPGINLKTSCILFFLISLMQTIIVLAQSEESSKSQEAFLKEKGVRFGSYGRIGFGATTEGKSIQKYEIVGHPPRVFEGNYVEIDLGYTLDSGSDKYIKILSTTAFMANFFHYSGQPDVEMAIRNLFLEVKGYLAPWFTVWAGSRMYRGDDIYLLDFWPMDCLNTLGGGFSFNPGQWEFKMHIGVNRLNNEFQFQQIKTSEDGINTRTVVFMDRQRYIASLKATRFVIFRPDWSYGVKFSIYGEFHGLPEGYYYHEDRSPEKFPADTGWLAGFQAGIWGFARDSWLNLWIKGSGGLASYGEFAIPFGIDSEKKSSRARDFLLGISENWEFGRGGLVAGTYLRYFKDADPNVYDLDDYWEGVLVMRLQIYVSKMIHIALEGGESFRRTTGLSNTEPVFDPKTMSFIPPRHEIPSVTHAALMLIYSPMGMGTFTRPQIRVIGTLQAPNSAARHLYPKEDVRSGGNKLSENMIWTIGLQAEWWFNSSYR